MFICLCLGVTRQDVLQAVAAGASTSNDVARMCGAGSKCAGCRRSVRAVIDSTHQRPSVRFPHVSPAADTRRRDLAAAPQPTLPCSRTNRTLAIESADTRRVAHADSRVEAVRISSAVVSEPR